MYLHKLTLLGLCSKKTCSNNLQSVDKKLFKKLIILSQLKTLIFFREKFFKRKRTWYSHNELEKSNLLREKSSRRQIVIISIVLP